MLGLSSACVRRRDDKRDDMIHVSCHGLRSCHRDLGAVTAQDVAVLAEGAGCKPASLESLSQLSDASTAPTNLPRRPRISFCEESQIFHVPSRTNLREDGAYDVDPEPMRLDDNLADGPEEEAADWAAFHVELAARRRALALEAQRRRAAADAWGWWNYGASPPRFAVDDNMSDEYARRALEPAAASPRPTRPAPDDRHPSVRGQVECAPAAATARMRPLPHQQDQRGVLHLC